MKGPFLIALLCALAVPTPVAAEAPDGVPMRGPLDLSLPRHAPTGTWRPAPSEGAAPLPDLGGTPGRMGDSGLSLRGAGRWNDLPYGSGYEARQRGGGRGR